MPIEFDPSVIEAFFGTSIVVLEPGGHGVSGTMDYCGKNLKYNLVFSDTDEVVSISGDPDVPFGADSFYEFNIPCDSITQSQDGYYPEQTGLNFWYGDRAEKHNLMMMLLKRPDGDLKVWPACPWPPRHRLHQVCWNESDSKPCT